MDFLDCHKVLLHIDKLRALARGEMVYPVEIELDLTNRCNNHCKWCRYKNIRDDSELPYQTLVELFHQLSEWVSPPSIVLVGGGEPTIHPCFEGVLDTIRELKFECGLFTNGHLLTGNIADAVGKTCRWVRISADAGDSLTYAKGHGVSPAMYGVVLSNAREFAAKHQDIPLGLTFVATDDNVESLPDFFREASRIHPSYVQVRPDVNGGPIRRIREIVRHQGRLCGPTLYLSGCRSNHCSHCITSPLVAVVGADGNIYRCCNYRGCDPLGNINDDMFDTIWFSDKHKEDWRMFDASRCQPCRFVGYNELVEDCILSDTCHGRFL